MGETVISNREIEKPVVTYYPESDALCIDTDSPQADGAMIAEGVVVFYDAEDSNSVSGIYIYNAEEVLKPLIEYALRRRDDPNYSISKISNNQ